MLCTSKANRVTTTTATESVRLKVINCARNEKVHYIFCSCAVVIEEKVGNQNRKWLRKWRVCFKRAFRCILLCDGGRNFCGHLRGRSEVNGLPNDLFCSGSVWNFNRWAKTYLICIIRFSGKILIPEVPLIKTNDCAYNWRLKIFHVDLEGCLKEYFAISRMELFREKCYIFILCLAFYCNTFLLVLFNRIEFRKFCCVFNWPIW